MHPKTLLFLFLLPSHTTAREEDVSLLPLWGISTTPPRNTLLQASTTTDFTFLSLAPLTFEQSRPSQIQVDLGLIGFHSRYLAPLTLELWPAPSNSSSSNGERLRFIYEDRTQVVRFAVMEGPDGKRLEKRVSWTVIDRPIEEVEVEMFDVARVREKSYVLVLVETLVGGGRVRSVSEEFRVRFGPVEGGTRTKTVVVTAPVGSSTAVSGGAGSTAGSGSMTVTRTSTEEVGSTASLSSSVSGKGEVKTEIVGPGGTRDGGFSEAPTPVPSDDAEGTDPPDEPEEDAPQDSTDAPKPSGSNIGMIAGGVAGGLVVLGAIVWGMVLLRRRRQKEKPWYLKPVPAMVVQVDSPTLPTTHPTLQPEVPVRLETETEVREMREGQGRW